jgi:hypothetical protein
MLGYLGHGQAVEIPQRQRRTLWTGQPRERRVCGARVEQLLPRIIGVVETDSRKPRRSRSPRTSPVETSATWARGRGRVPATTGLARPAARPCQHADALRTVGHDAPASSWRSLSPEAILGA